MRNINPYGIICLIGLITFPSSGWAAEGPSSTGAGYLDLPIGPKSIAMGEMRAALIGDPFNWTANPGS